MIQYQVKYITHNDRIAVCYLYADNFEEVTAKEEEKEWTNIMYTQ